VTIHRIPRYTGTYRRIGSPPTLLNSYSNRTPIPYYLPLSSSPTCNTTTSCSYSLYILLYNFYSRCAFLHLHLYCNPYTGADEIAELAVQLDALRVARGTIFVSSARQSPRAERANICSRRAARARGCIGGAGMPRGRPPDRAMARTDLWTPSLALYSWQCASCVCRGMTAAGMGVCVHGFCCVVHRTCVGT
jgi:hypothetical protein